MNAVPVGYRRRSLPLTKVERETVQNLPLEKFHYSKEDYKLELQFDAAPCASEGSKVLIFSSFSTQLLHRVQQQ